jgi:hypothetical protein
MKRGTKHRTAEEHPRVALLITYRQEWYSWLESGPRPRRMSPRSFRRTGNGAVVSDRGERWTDSEAACKALECSESLIRMGCGGNLRAKGRQIWWERDSPPAVLRRARGADGAAA